MMLLRSALALASFCALAACGGGSSSSSSPPPPPPFPATPQINASNYLDVFAVTSIAFARSDLLVDAGDAAFAASLSSAPRYFCAQSGFIETSLDAGTRSFAFRDCRTPQRYFAAGAMTSANLSGAVINGVQALTDGDFALKDLAVSIASPPDALLESMQGQVRIQRGSSGAVVISGAFDVLRNGRADSYTDLSLGRTAPDAQGQTRPALGFVRIASPRSPSSLEAGVTLTSIVVRAPDGSYLEISDAAGGAGYQMRVYRGAGDVAQLTQTWSADAPEIKRALSHALL